MPYKSVFHFFTGLLCLLLIGTSFANGQELLKSLTVINKGGKNEINWVQDYNNIKLIGIQRAHDSLGNYSTIGHAMGPNKEQNQYTDKKPVAGANYYRLFILLTNGSYFFTHPSKIILLPATLSNSNSKHPTSFQPSIFVYTNPDGNVNISLVDATKNHYTIRFYDAQNHFLFEVNKIKRSLLILDKTNFLHSGWFHYELYKNGVINEKWKFYIPAQGEKPSN